MKTIWAVAFSAAMILPARSEPELKGSPAELTAYLSGIPQTVVVAGEAELKVEADRARITLRVATENASLAEALGKNSTLRTQIAEKLKRDGIPFENIVGTRFSSTPQYGLFGGKAKAYRVEDVLRITVRDEKDFLSVAAVIDSHPDLSYEGMDLESSNESELKARVLGLACDAAVGKKKLYEERLGVRLLPRGFSEKRVGKECPEPPQKERGSSRGRKLVNISREEYAPPPVQGARFDEIVYRAEVVLECDLKRP